MNSYHENKCTFASPTFKDEENKGPLFFCSNIRLLRYELLLLCQNVCSYVHYQVTNPKMSKSSYLHQITSDPKNKGTLFSPTSKVVESKMHLFS